MFPSQKLALKKRKQQNRTSTLNETKRSRQHLLPLFSPFSASKYRGCYGSCLGYNRPCRCCGTMQRQGMNSISKREIEQQR
jgi:hypothetical protein